MKSVCRVTIMDKTETSLILVSRPQSYKGSLRGIMKLNVQNMISTGLIMLKMTENLSQNLLIIL